LELWFWLSCALAVGCLIACLFNCMNVSTYADAVKRHHGSRRLDDELTEIYYLSWAIGTGLAAAVFGIIALFIYHAGELTF
jgi:membrane associated rhomboid family serine protease